MKLFTSRFKFREWHHSDEVCQACELFLFVRFGIGRKMLLYSVNLQLIVMERCFSTDNSSRVCLSCFSISSERTKDCRCRWQTRIYCWTTLKMENIVQTLQLENLSTILIFFLFVFRVRRSALVFSQSAI